MTRRFPFQVKLVNVLHVLGADQLSDKLELLPEFENALLEDHHLTRRPFLKDEAWSHRVYKDIQVALFVEMVHRVQVELNRLFLFLGVGFEDVVLGVNHLQNRMLSRSKSPQQRDEGVILARTIALQNLLQDNLEIRFG